MVSGLAAENILSFGEYLKFVCGCCFIILNYKKSMIYIKKRTYGMHTKIGSVIVLDIAKLFQDTVCLLYFVNKLQDYICI